MVKVIKNINNNVSLCEDSSGKQVVAFGKGLGFKKPPYEIDLSQIERTYYDVDESFISMMNDIPEATLKIADELVNYARRTLDAALSSNIVFTLADHIHFCIQRYEKKMNMKLPIYYDLEQLFEREMQVGKYAITIIRKKLHVDLPEEEAAYIALHLINAQEKEKGSYTVQNDQVIQDLIQIIEKDFDMKIKKEDFNYSRFVSHMHYLLKRGRKKELLQTENDRLYQTMKQDYPQALAAAEKVSVYFKNQLHVDLTDEEKLYLILHINRLCTREDCYR